ncbi:hypothetical protein BFM98_01460 [Lysinibacillus sp. AR18-8]|nr:hypothetical protein VK91_12400 [Lysinibacillus sp. LK3]OCX62695.1 hypothetical protein BFM98_01460 [Lysinibacillus sp. AR18-8]
MYLYSRNLFNQKNDTDCGKEIILTLREFISFFPYKIVPVQTFFIYIFTNWGTILKKVTGAPASAPKSAPVKYT